MINQKIGCLLVSGLMCGMGISNSYAHGQNGHRIIGEIGQLNLTPKAKQKIMAITDSQSLAKLSTWPDEIRSSGMWDHASPWHYISADTEADLTGSNRNPRGDILSTLNTLEQKLKNPRLSKKEKWQSLAFFVHMVGDLHQPLHVGFAEDRGGNKVKVKWFNEHSNLHRVWDTHLIDNQKLSYKEYVEFLPVSKKEKLKWQQGTFLDWAKESLRYREQTYKFDRVEKGIPKLGYKYIYNNRELSEQRLKQAGIRLAYKLNQIFK
ncbi:S1/P1 Nuclease [Parashewanella curva]|uniref:S1/P1 Nuclease n=1 Tax=Parashewanella curva TaxID=2338552 RepID=A0A3L8Q0T8_9GAMM|nr:S1/P1 nuclease [Parashewanella curva]RLV61194.1 S1/P1 Nuclease [Parashewanella curva]